jgi:hypothetical protein
VRERRHQSGLVTSFFFSCPGLDAFAGLRPSTRVKRSRYLEPNLAPQKNPSLFCDKSHTVFTISLHPSTIWFAQQSTSPGDSKIAPEIIFLELHHDSGIHWIAASRNPIVRVREIATDNVIASSIERHFIVIFHSQLSRSV